jgi:hypothetical protein
VKPFSRDVLFSLSLFRISNWSLLLMLERMGESRWSPLVIMGELGECSKPGQTGVRPMLAEG